MQGSSYASSPVSGQRPQMPRRCCCTTNKTCLHSKGPNQSWGSSSLTFSFCSPKERTAGTQRQACRMLYRGTCLEWCWWFCLPWKVTVSHIPPLSSCFREKEPTRVLNCRRRCMFFFLHISMKRKSFTFPRLGLLYSRFLWYRFRLCPAALCFCLCSHFRLVSLMKDLLV